jgi:hypothetical protein
MPKPQRGAVIEIIGAQTDFIHNKTLESQGFAVDAQNVRMTAEDNDVLDFLNVTLTKVTDVGRFQCLS